MSFSSIALVAGLLLGSVSANTPLASSSPVHSQANVSCRTVLGTSSVSAVPTTTVTRTIHDTTPIVISSTTQATVTVTPDVSTVLVTDYETTTLTTTTTPVTDTFSTTSTELDTITVTITPAAITSTVSTTLSTTITSTSTVATSAGFTPIADTLPTATLAKRSEPEESCSPLLDDYQYPQSVECHQKTVLKTTVVETITATPITATAPGSTTTVTTTNTITTSSVVIPTDVSTTLSFSTTSTITETSTAAPETTTVTSTSTIAATTTTSFYAACATNNIAGAPLSSDFGSFADEYIYYITFSSVPGEKLSVGNTASAYDCCVSCMESSTCALSYYNAVTSSVKYCYLIGTTSCSSDSTYAVASIHGSASTIQMSNGMCGRVKGQSG